MYIVLSHATGIPTCRCNKYDVSTLTTSSLLQLYADDTITYDSDKCPVKLKFSINTDAVTVDCWFCNHFFTINVGKTQGMMLVRSDHDTDLKIGDTSIQIANTVKILGVTLDKRLMYEFHIKEMLKKVYAKVVALRGIMFFMCSQLHGPQYILKYSHRITILGILD